MLLAACALHMVAHASRAGSQNKKQATGPTSLQIAETAVSSKKNIYSDCKAVSNIQQFSQLYKTGNTVTVLAKLAAHALRAIATRTRSQKQNPLAFGHVQLNIHANFHSCIKQENR